MKKIFTTLAVVAIMGQSFAQVISQNAQPNVVAASSSVACGNQAQGFTSGNYYSRAFTLADYSINYDYKITNVAFGVQTTNGTFDTTLNVYSQTGATYPGGTQTLLASAPVSVSQGDMLGMVNSGTSLTTTIPSGGAFVVEVFHDGADSGQVFYIGANGAGQTKPSYIKSSDCGIATPVNPTTLGSFPNAMWVMTVTGQNALGVVEVINSRDLQVANPVKDALNFRFANGNKAEGIELIDMTGKKVNLFASSRSNESVNVSHLAKGVYILKIKANDGKVYTQKIIKE